LNHQPLLTIFTAPKPFRDPHITIIQRNAIQSWLHLDNEKSHIEVFMVGSEEGMAQAAQENGVAQLGPVQTNEQGTPLISSIFDLARQSANSPLLAYANADILFLPDLVQAVHCLSQQMEKFLMIGQRWDLDVKQPLEFSPGWDHRLRQDVAQRGRLHLPAGSDFFIFRRDQYSDLPNFAVGRAGWDNWMIYHARQQGWPVVDATPSVMAIHQNHDYSHLPGGKPHYELPESDYNQALAGGSARMFMILDSSHELRKGEIRRPRPSLLRLLRQGEVYFTPPDGSRTGLRWSIARRFRRARRRITGSLQ
jgi:hypothetical protein